MISDVEGVMAQDEALLTASKRNCSCARQLVSGSRFEPRSCWIL